MVSFDFTTVIVFICIYIWGAVPYSIIVTRVKGIDLLSIGSGNAGATNVYRALGFKYAAFVFLLDFLKGYTACLAAGYLFSSDIAVVIAAATVIVGHTFSPFLKFKGGKGAATGLGVLLYIQPVLLLIAGLIAALIIKVTRYVSLATITSAAILVLLAYLPFFALSTPYRIFLLFIAAYIIYKHKANISRLLQGQEKKV